MRRTDNTILITGRRQELLDEITKAHPGMHGIALELEDAAATYKFAADVRGASPSSMF